jgi:phage portal protein BeeE
MAFLQNMASGFKASVRSLFSRGARSLGNILSYVLGVEAVWPVLHAEKGIYQGYSKVLAIFALINKDAAKFAMVPRYVYDLTANETGKTGKKVKLTGSQYRDLLKLLRKPNPYQTQSEFLEAVKIMYQSCGESVVWLNRGDTRAVIEDGLGNYAVDSNGQIQFRERSDEEVAAMPVLEMYVLPSAFVGIIPDPSNVFGVLGYWFETGDGSRKFIRKVDIIHWKRYNPLFNYTNGDHLRGLSPVEVGSCDVAEYKEIAKSSMRMHMNDGAKGIVVNKTLAWDDLSEAQQNAIIEKVDGKLNSNDVKGKVQIMGGDWDYKEIGKKSVDLETLQAKKLKWQELCFLFDVPFNFFDQNAKYSNASEWQKSWIYNSVMPACQRFDEKLSEALMKAFNLEDRAEICGDFMSLPELQKNLSELSAAFNNMWYVSPNQKLIASGFDPVPNPLFDEPWVPMGIQPLSQYGAEQAFQEDSTKLDDNEY